MIYEYDIYCNVIYFYIKASVFSYEMLFLAKGFKLKLDFEYPYVISMLYTPLSNDCLACGVVFFLRT